MNRTLAILILSLLGASTEVRAQDSTGFAFARRPLKNGADFADCIKRDDRKCLWATRVEILSAVMDRHPAIRTFEALEAYVRNLVNVECPQGVMVNLYRILVTGKKHTVESGGWRRMFRRDEVCLADTNNGLIEFSLWCGNPIGEDVEIQLPKQEKPKVLPTVAERNKDTIYVVGHGSSVEISVSGEKHVVRDNLVLSLKDAVLSVRVVKDSTIVSTTIINRVDTVVMKRTNWTATVATGLLSGLAGYFLGARQEVNVSNTCGGPVNPPNSIMRFTRAQDRGEVGREVFKIKIPF